MGASRGICRLFLQGCHLPFVDPCWAHNILGYLVEEMADRLAECFCTVLCRGGTAIAVLASICAHCRCSWEAKAQDDLRVMLYLLSLIQSRSPMGIPKYRHWEVFAGTTTWTFRFHALQVTICHFRRIVTTEKCMPQSL